MAKTIQDRRLTLVIVLSKEGGAPIATTCRADYEVSSEDLAVSRSMEINLTLAQATTLKNFALNNVLPAIKQAENVL